MELSEPGGVFVHSDNLASNETHFPEMIRMLGARGGAYVGVGPEQNFSYIAGLRPEIAFIIDIRRENRNLHLMYKALFEAASDRVEFVSRLFSRRPPPQLEGDPAVEQLFTAYRAASPDSGLFAATAAMIRDRLLTTHRLTLQADDVDSIEAQFRAFFTAGPDIHYGQGALVGPSYSALMAAEDLVGQPRSFLASDEAFDYVKDLHGRNLIVPLVGDFAGPHAVRRVGEFVRQHGANVEVFYASNVEVYLRRDQNAMFCRSLAGLPHGTRSWFIGNKGMRSFRSKLEACSE